MNTQSLSTAIAAVLLIVIARSGAAAGPDRSLHLTIFVGNSNATEGDPFAIVAQIDNPSKQPIALDRVARLEPVYVFPQMSPNDKDRELRRSMRLRPSGNVTQLIIHLQQPRELNHEYQFIPPLVELAPEKMTIAPDATQFIRCDLPKSAMLHGQCVLQIGLYVNGQEVAVSDSVPVACSLSTSK